MPSRITTEEALKRFNNDPCLMQFINIDLSTYTNYTSKCRFIDSEYGEWWTLPKYVIDLKCKHPLRSIAEQTQKRIISIEEVKKRIKKVHGNVVTLDEKTYINITGKSRFIDKDFGEFYSITSHICNGHSHPKRGILKCTQSRIASLRVVQESIQRIHGDSITILPETYRSINFKAIFIHKEYGLWETTPNNVISKKSNHPAGAILRAKSTFIKNYGVDNPNKDPKIFKKGQSSRWDTCILPHWKDGREILCRASYEYAVVSRLNILCINYDWQIRFILPSSSVYFCDLYLIENNKYVEIKGIFHNENTKRKWLEFHKIVPNSELWNESLVVSFTNKSIYRIKKEFREIINAKKKDS